MFFIPWDSSSKNDYIDWFSREKKSFYEAFSPNIIKKHSYLYSFVLLLGKGEQRSKPLWHSIILIG